VDAEEFSGLPDRDVFLALLCALCAVFSHGPMLDPSEPPRKPLEAILACLEENARAGIVGREKTGPKKEGGERRKASLVGCPRTLASRTGPIMHTSGHFHRTFIARHYLGGCPAVVSHHVASSLTLCGRRVRTGGSPQAPSSVLQARRRRPGGGRHPYATGARMLDDPR
jgi:hypothetical protein